MSLNLNAVDPSQLQKIVPILLQLASGASGQGGAQSLLDASGLAPTQTDGFSGGDMSGAPLANDPSASGASLLPILEALLSSAGASGSSAATQDFGRSPQEEASESPEKEATEHKNGHHHHRHHATQQLDATQQLAQQATQGA